MKQLYLSTNLFMAVVGFALERCAPPRTLWWAGVPVLMTSGIACGVLGNAFYEEEVRHISHNLAPFEVLIQWTLFLPGLLVGLVTGGITRKR